VIVSVIRVRAGVSDQGGDDAGGGVGDDGADGDLLLVGGVPVRSGDGG
jgi:hypothetical protein